MTVAEFIEYLKTQPQDLQVAYRCHSEADLLDVEDIEISTRQKPRPDGWIGDRRSDKPKQDYLLLPGN